MKRCGNVIEIRHMTVKPCPTIQKMDKDHYVNLITGEIMEIAHNENRATDPSSVAQSLRKLRDIINTNIVNAESVLWVTLTYRENMTDVQQLYEDYRRFWQRFQYYLKKQGYPKAEYIIAAEPQGRGAWHLHALFLFPDRAPFIPNDDMAKTWGHGFTKTKRLSGIDNPGLYLTAYLGNMEITEAISAGKMSDGRLVESRSGSKAVIKGARLKMYPVGMNLYRCSRGVKKPDVQQITEDEAQSYVQDIPLVYEKILTIKDETGTVRNSIYYRQYNKAYQNKHKGTVVENGVGTDFATPENPMPPQRHTADNAKQNGGEAE